MPVYTFKNETDHDAYIRVYNPAAYVIRSSRYDPYYLAFTVDPRTTGGCAAHAHELVFKVVLFGKDSLKSGNVTPSKKPEMTDDNWKALQIGFVIDIDDAHDAVHVA